MTATQEFVVPRSIPITLPKSRPLSERSASSPVRHGSRRGFPCRASGPLVYRFRVVCVLALRDLHERGTQQTVLEGVALPEDLDDGAFRLARHHLVGERLMDLRIET